MLNKKSRAPEIKIPLIFLAALFLLGASLPGRAQKDAVPLYRLLVVEPTDPNDLFSPTVRDRHFYTTDKAVKNSAVNKMKYEFEGIEGYLIPPPFSPKGTMRLRHLIRQRDGENFYTASSTEAADAENQLGYKETDILGSVWTKQIEGTVPLYRLYRAGGRDDHFYTISETEKNAAIKKSGYRFEGVVGYVFPKPTTIDAKGYPIKSAAFPGAEDFRRNIIKNVYLTAMGRPAQASELDYWLPRKENFDQMIAASRTWLYSPSGAKDLRETIVRAYLAKNDQPPTNAFIKNAIASLKPEKLIFKEIVQRIEKYDPKKKPTLLDNN